MKVFTHNRYGTKKKEGITEWNISDNQKKKLLKFVEDYETGKITNRTPTNSEALVERLLDYLKFSLTHLDADKLEEKDVEKFFDNLYKDKYKSFNDKPYSIKTKISILNTLSKYLSWLYPNKPELIKPLKINIKSKNRDIPSLKIEEIDELYKNCKNSRERYFISVLFSSGTRAEEFHNIRFSDIELPKENETFVKIRLRSEFSKTEGRTISLYYRNCLEAVREFLEERKQDKIKPEDVVFPYGYDTQRESLRAMGERVLKKRINYHLFRHTCASWLASRLNRQQLCIFFGWKFSSNMPDVYIKRSNVEMDEVSKEFENTQIEELQTKLTKEEFERKLLQENIDTKIKEAIKKFEAKLLEKMA